MGRNAADGYRLIAARLEQGTFSKVSANITTPAPVARSFGTASVSWPRPQPDEIDRQSRRHHRRSGRRLQRSRAVPPVLRESSSYYALGFQSADPSHHSRFHKVILAGAYDRDGRHTGAARAGSVYAYVGVPDSARSPRSMSGIFVQGDRGALVSPTGVR
jgi:hypothetical protein